MKETLLIPVIIRKQFVDPLLCIAEHPRGPVRPHASPLVSHAAGASGPALPPGAPVPSKTGTIILGGVYIQRLVGGGAAIQHATPY